MRVLHVHSGNLYGGVETFLMSLARSRAYAPAMGTRVALSFEGNIAERLREAGVPVAILGASRLSRPLSVWRARRSLSALLDREKPDVVVCHQAWPLALFGGVVRQKGVPLVLWVHMAATGHWLERLASRVTPDLIICNSKFTASTLPKTSTRVEVVYPPAFALRASAGGPDAAPPTPAGSTDTTRSDIVIIQVSRMERLKGHAVLLDALGALRERTGWTCWQVGGAQRPEEGRYVASLRDQAKRLGIAERVRFLGHRSDVPDLLAQAHIYAQPNVEPEAFGLSLIEALTAGLPVLTSAIGGALEIVDETCGVLVPPGDSVTLAATLARLLDDRQSRERLGSNGPARAMALCDPRRLMPQIAEILGSVCAAAAS